MGPVRNILSTNIQSAIGEANNFLITSTGEIRVLKEWEQILWQKFGHNDYVKNYFNVDHEKLENLISENPNNQILKENVSYLVLRGRIKMRNFEKPEQKELQERIKAIHQSRIEEKSS